MPTDPVPRDPLPTDPAIVMVAADAAGRDDLLAEMASRYGRDYDLAAFSNPDDALADIERRAAADEPVAMVIARTCIDDPIAFCTAARAIAPAAKRVVLRPWGEGLGSFDALRIASNRGLIDTTLLQPSDRRDEEFHTAISEYLSDWFTVAGTPLVDSVALVGDADDPKLQTLRQWFDRGGVEFGVYAPDSARAQEIAAALPPGAPLPHVQFLGAIVMSDPTPAELFDASGRSADLTQTYDVAVVGSGPAGLAAAVYGASEGLSTLLIEADHPGGQAGTSSMIRNYLGFPRGISGRRLAQRGLGQAVRFGTQIHQARAVTDLVPGSPHRLRLEDGREVAARTVVIASGATYRRIGVPSIEEHVGNGVTYGAPMSEARAMAGQLAVVVGGGNSAGQAALHLARFAERVKIVVRRGDLSETMSEYLIKEIANHERIVVYTHAEVVDGGGDGRLEWVTYHRFDTDEKATAPCAGLFLMLGAVPRTDWIPDPICLDDKGFVLTGSDLPAGRWHLDRAPGHLETCIPGVYAVGDVRSGSVKRVAAAAGEGAVVVPMLHAYLDEERRAHVAATNATADR